MKILAMDLSSGRGSIAWSGGAGEVFDVAFANDRKHSGQFFENLQETLQRFGTPELIVVGLGPGSYAGTRIAIAAASGLAAATGAHVCGLSSARAFGTDVTEYSVVGDARRQSFFFAHVVARECMEGPLLYTRDELLTRIRGVRSRCLRPSRSPMRRRLFFRIHRRGCWRRLRAKRRRRWPRSRSSRSTCESRTLRIRNPRVEERPGMNNTDPAAVGQRSASTRCDITRRPRESSPGLRLRCSR
jgi:tRNA threonylcarbamoyl adenosine modification protein YeaZ